MAAMKKKSCSSLISLKYLHSQHSHKAHLNAYYGPDIGQEWRPGLKVHDFTPVTKPTLLGSIKVLQSNMLLEIQKINRLNLAQKTEGNTWKEGETPGSWLTEAPAAARSNTC